MSTYSKLLKIFTELNLREDLNEYMRLQLIAVRPLTNENKIH